VLEKLKAAGAEEAMNRSQALLLPEVVEIEEGDLGILRGEGGDDLRADAGGTAGDEYDLAGEVKEIACRHRVSFARWA
jgi:hypothetical protein